MYTRAGEIPPAIPGLPHPIYPVTDPLGQQQRMQAMSHGILHNYAAPQLNAIQPPQIPKNKRMKLEEIVGRLKDSDKTD